MTMNLRKKTFLLLSFFFVSGLFAAPAEAEKAEKKEELPYPELLTMMHVMQQIRARYVDSGKTSYKDLMRGAMRGMLNSLDRFSNYESPEMFKNTVQDTQGSFGGIGATFREKDKTITLISIVKNGPAEKAGLKAGDILTGVDDVSAASMTLPLLTEKIKGKIGTDVKIKIRRPSDNSEKEFTVTRDTIHIYTVVNSGMLYGKTGYVRLSQFSIPTASELDEFLKANKAGEMDGLIVDLRFNPGGLVDSVKEVLSRFLPEGKLIVSVEGRGSPTVRHESMDSEKYLDLPLVVLVNGMSASASEIFAGCMKDYKRAVLVGTKTFGKGSVQELVRLPDGGGIRLTIAKYYTPNRLEIHEKGIVPDIVVPVDRAQEQRTIEFLSTQTDKMPDPAGDPQLARAVEIMKAVQTFRAGTQK